MGSLRATKSKYKKANMRHKKPKRENKRPKKSELDIVLGKLNKARETEISLKLISDFKEILLRTSSENRGKGPDFSRMAGDGTDGELRFRNKLVWLNTLPLERDEVFITLHSETGGYYHEKEGKYSADILGICSNARTTQFAVIELKAGRGSNSVFYALAEGLRNVYLLWQEREKLSRLWKKYSKDCVKNETIQKTVWENGNPFNELDKNNIRLLIMGDRSWIEAQGECVRQIPNEIRLERINIKISVYSLEKRGKSRSKPYKLLPLKKFS